MRNVKSRSIMNVINVRAVPENMLWFCVLYLYSINIMYIYIYIYIIYTYHIGLEVRMSVSGY